MRNAERYVLAAVSAVVLVELIQTGVDRATTWFWHYMDSCNIRKLEREFDILGELGSGKTSRIYKARNRKRGRIVALKVLTKLSIVVFESNAFNVERRILQKITHPHIIGLYNAFSRGCCDVLEMECATDGSLFYYVHEHGTLSEMQTLRLICQMLDALLYLYDAHGIIHRDIKPENILVFKDPLVACGIEEKFYSSILRENEIHFKLCDFGFSGDDKCLCGTQYYTEPHVYSGEQKHTFGSDVWSLGIVVHYALYGVNPYYDLTMGRRKKEDYLPSVCMETEKWNALGPRLQSFFALALSTTKERTVKAVRRVRDSRIGGELGKSTVFVIELAEEFMSGSGKKVSLADIYVQSIQKDNAFLKEKVSTLQKEIESLNVKYEEDRKKQQQEKIALQDDLSKMVRDISSLRNENTSLKEEINEYDANYVPASGSQRMKDALAETRQTLRETVEKYNEMVDSYDATREKCSSACIEADALRNDNETMRGELNRVHLLYQAAAKELEQNRDDMGDMMKEMASLRQALEQKESSESSAPVARGPLPDVNAKLVVSLRRQIADLSSSLELVTRENSSLKTRVNAQSSSSSAQLAEWKKRAAQAEEKVKTLSASLMEVTSDRDRLLVEQQDGAGSAGSMGSAGASSSAEEVSAWKQKSDELERKVIELTQRNRNFERSVGSMVTRCDAAEKKAKELEASLQAAKQAAAQAAAQAAREKESLQKSLLRAQQERDAAVVEKTRAAKGTGSVGELRKKDELIEQLRASVMQLESELQQQQQLVEQLKSEAAAPPLPASTPGPIPSMASSPSPYNRSVAHEMSHEMPHEMTHNMTHEMAQEQVQDPQGQTAVVEAGAGVSPHSPVESAEDAITGVLQQMIAAPELFSLDTIDDISFPDCGFNDDHMQQFITFLKQNDFPSLVSIDVSHNLLTERSVIPFIRVLLEKRVSSLQKLDLSYNQLDDHFADSLLDVLIHASSGSSIRCIEFEGNLFSDGVLQQMKQICGGSL